MGALRLLIRWELRRRWRCFVVVALLVAFAGGVTLAAVAGAKRTSTSFDRFRTSVRSHDVLLFAEDVDRGDVHELRSLPGVAAIGYLRQLALVRPDGDFLAVGGPLDDAMFRDVNRLRIGETMEAIGARIGDRVTGSSPEGDFEYRIVGRIVVPSLTEPQAVADGAVFTGSGLVRLETRENVSASAAPVVRFRSGVDQARAAQQIDRLPGVGRPGNAGLLRPRVPLEVDRLQQVDRVPFALAVFLTILGGPRGRAPALHERATPPA